jgi:translation initiation factor IF-2
MLGRRRAATGTPWTTTLPREPGRHGWPRSGPRPRRGRAGPGRPGRPRTTPPPAKGGRRRHRTQGLQDIAGPVSLDGQPGSAPLPGQNPHDLPILRAEVGVSFQPAVAALPGHLAAGRAGRRRGAASRASRAAGVRRAGGGWPGLPRPAGGGPWPGPANGCGRGGPGRAGGAADPARPAAPLSRAVGDLGCWGYRWPTSGRQPATGRGRAASRRRAGPDPAGPAPRRSGVRDQPPHGQWLPGAVVHPWMTFGCRLWVYGGVACRWMWRVAGGGSVRS